jgi:hypothetical protein
MYNFQKLVMAADNMWNPDRDVLCARLHNDVTGLRSLSNRTLGESKSTPGNASNPSLSTVNEAAQLLAFQGYHILEFSSTVRTFGH